MAHPAIAVLEAMIAEEETDIVAMQTEYQALIDEEGAVSWRAYLKLRSDLLGLAVGIRNSKMAIRMAKIQIAILPPTQ